MAEMTNQEATQYIHYINNELANQIKNLFENNVLMTSFDKDQEIEPIYPYYKSFKEYKLKYDIVIQKPRIFTRYQAFSIKESIKINIYITLIISQKNKTITLSQIVFYTKDHDNKFYIKKSKTFIIHQEEQLLINEILQYINRNLILPLKKYTANKILFINSQIDTNNNESKQFDELQIINEIKNKILNTIQPYIRKKIEKKKKDQQAQTTYTAIKLSNNLFLKLTLSTAIKTDDANFNCIFKIKLIKQYANFNYVLFDEQFYIKEIEDELEMHRLEIYIDRIIYAIVYYLKNK